MPCKVPSLVPFPPIFSTPPMEYPPQFPTPQLHTPISSSSSSSSSPRLYTRRVELLLLLFLAPPQHRRLEAHANAGSEEKDCFFFFFCVCAVFLGFLAMVIGAEIKDEMEEAPPLLLDEAARPRRVALFVEPSPFA
jgi:hypothetical protein